MSNEPIAPHLPPVGSGRRVVLGVSGASGMPYARALLRTLLDESGYEIHLMFSPAAGEVLRRECDIGLDGGKVDVAKFADWTDGLTRLSEKQLARVIQYSPRDIGGAPASGSFVIDAMVICPASMRTVGALSVGLTDNLLTRAADVSLKEGRKLIVVPRETPLSLIHLRALTTLAEAGARIVPAMPGFYTRPETLDDAVRFLVMKILDQLGISYSEAERWEG